MTAEDAIAEVAAEYAQAKAKFPPMNSAHEGRAVIEEEFDELWAEIKKRPDQIDRAAIKREAVHLAAMALRFLVDIC